MTTIQPSFAGQRVSAGNVETTAASSGGDAGDGKLKVGTYNLGAGNKGNWFSAGGREQIDETGAHLASQVTGEEPVDVVALQEVDVGTTDAAKYLPEPFTDYNEYVLAQVAAKEAGFSDHASFERTEKDGVVTITATEGGESSQVAITPEYFNQDGERVAAGASDAAITVYNAAVTPPDGASRNYTIVYGSSIAHDGGTFGNAVLIGPGATLQRDPATGLPDVARHDLGANDPGGENRTALEVGIVSGGEEATVFSAHLTSGKNSDQAAVDARLTQYEALGRLAADAGDNTILLGDFNTGGVETVGPLAGENDDENTGGEPIDRIYVSGDVAATGREHVEGGGSDHSLLTWNIDLNA